MKLEVYTLDKRFIELPVSPHLIPISKMINGDETDRQKIGETNRALILAAEQCNACDIIQEQMEALYVSATEGLLKILKP